jgi:hypothetical protein
MVKSLTGSFYLTETLTLPAATASGGRVQGEIDLGAYVNVPTGQAVAIESVDFIYQTGSDFGGEFSGMVVGNAAISVQLSDLNPGTALRRADDQSLIASGCLNIDGTNNIGSHWGDIYADNFGPASASESYMVVNDTLYLVAGPDGGAIDAVDVSVTARIRCRVIKLDSKTWMSIAIQSTASDN